MNSITLLGNLTHDPKLFYSSKGIAVMNSAIAVNERRNPNKTMFIDIVAFKGLAEIFNQYARKGTKVLIQGRIEYDQYVDKQGNKRQKHKVIVDELEMLDGPQKNNQPNQNYQDNQDQQADEFFEQRHTTRGDIVINDEEIPF